MLYLIIEPKVLISNIKKPEIILGSLYSEALNLLFGYFLAYAFRRKSDKATAILTFVFAMLLDCFVEVTYESEFIKQNLALVIAVSTLTIFVLLFVWFQEKIRNFLDRYANHMVEVLVLVLFFCRAYCYGDLVCSLLCPLLSILRIPLDEYSMRVKLNEPFKAMRGVMEMSVFRKIVTLKTKQNPIREVFSDRIFLLKGKPPTKSVLPKNFSFKHSKVYTANYEAAVDRVIFDKTKKSFGELK